MTTTDEGLILGSELAGTFEREQKNKSLSNSINEMKTAVEKNRLVFQQSIFQSAMNSPKILSNGYRDPIKYYVTLLLWHHTFQSN